PPTGCPPSLVNPPWRRRPSRSGPPPGGEGTTSLIGLSGYADCAGAAAVDEARAANVSATSANDALGMRPVALQQTNTNRTSPMIREQLGAYRERLELWRPLLRRG